MQGSVFIPLLALCLSCLITGGGALWFLSGRLADIAAMLKAQNLRFDVFEKQVTETLSHHAETVASLRERMATLEAKMNQ
jgi:hypothetical protein